MKGALSCLIPQLCFHIVMTSSNESNFRVTGPLCGEFIGDRWIPHTMASHAELWCILWSSPEQTVEQTIEIGDLRRHRACYGVTVMITNVFFRWQVSVKSLQVTWSRGKIEFVIPTISEYGEIIWLSHRQVIINIQLDTCLSKVLWMSKTRNFLLRPS